MKALLFLMYNTSEEQFQMTKETFDSILAQDCGPMTIWMVDNGSSTPTKEWLRSLPSTEAHSLILCSYAQNMAVTQVVNETLKKIFDAGFDVMLGVPNDVVLPPNLYSEMLRFPRGIVTASGTSSRDFERFPKASAISENTPLAIVLIRKWAYDALVARDGYFFDPQIYHYASDCDLALRMGACGIRGAQLDIQFWHYGSGSHRLVPRAEGKAMTNQADRDRDYFARKWGFKVDSPDYGEKWKDLNFGVSR